MPEEDASPLKPTWSEKREAKDPTRFLRPGHIKGLFSAASRASHLGVTLLDSQARIEAVNGPLAQETRCSVEHHIGKTSREIVGDLASQIEPVYESVFRNGTPASIWLQGHVRDSIELGHWFGYCFPIFDTSNRVQQLGIFVVNVTAEKECAGILEALPGNSRSSSTHRAELLLRLEEAIQGYYLGLEYSFQELSRPSTEIARRVDHFRSKLQRLDNEIRLVRELVYTVMAEFQVPSC